MDMATDERIAEAKREKGEMWWFGTGIVCNCGVGGCLYSTPEAIQATTKRWVAAYVEDLEALKPFKVKPLPWWKFWA